MLIYSGVPDPQREASTTPMGSRQAGSPGKTEATACWVLHASNPNSLQRGALCIALPARAGLEVIPRGSVASAPGLLSLSSGSPHLTNQTQGYGRVRAVNPECQNLSAHGLTPTNTWSHLLQGSPWSRDNSSRRRGLSLGSGWTLYKHIYLLLASLQLFPKDCCHSNG